MDTDVNSGQKSDLVKKFAEFRKNNENEQLRIK